eukprot:scaffold281501_cov39-Tisochrysis_lutea.AAC.1
MARGQLGGKVVIVTGASRGVGAEIARVFAEEGASVVVNYLHSKEKAEAIAATINTSPHSGRAIAVYGDVTSKSDMEALVETALKEFGAVHVLVNNALASYQFNPAAAPASIKTLEWVHMQQQMDGTVRGAINAVQAVLPHFEAQGYGKVVMIGTNLVYNPVVTYYDYQAAKAAVVGLTRNLAAELGPKGVRVNLVAGGLLDTTDASALTTREVFDFVAAGTPLRRTTSVRDFAQACVFFASSASDAVTGQSIAVDGGLTMA